MIADAEKQVKLAVGSIQEQTAAEEKRLETAKAATAKFIEAARRHLQYPAQEYRQCRKRHSAAGGGGEACRFCG